MNLSYDIFELADIPVIVTDGDFVITYKNKLAAKLFCGFRRRSRISRYFRNFKNDADFSAVSELDIETGTQFMRALVMPIGENALAFLFFTVYAFTDTKKLLEYIREKFSANFIDFYCAVYSACKNAGRSDFRGGNSSERAYSELLTMMSFFSEETFSLREETFNISELLENITKKASRSLSAFGLNPCKALVFDEDCYAKINLRAFCFAVFRMLYIAFRLSDTGQVQVSLDSSRISGADVCIFTRTSLSPELVNESDFCSLMNVFPEFSFEFDILKKTGFLDNALCFTLENSTLKLHYKIKCETGLGFLLRSESEKERKKRADTAVSEMLSTIRFLLSKK